MTLSTVNAPLEKIALETYVPLAKPSLVGLSRAEIAERLGEIGVQASQRKMRTAQLWSYFGPAFVASIAYIDPGNFAANFLGGSMFGYKLGDEVPRALWAEHYLVP